MPQLRYPVGDPATIAARTGAYAVAAPADLVYDFRIRSLGLLALLYALLGAGFDVLSERAHAESNAADTIDQRV